MNKDPLSLTKERTPEVIRASRASPMPLVADIYARITNRDAADSLETKIVLLAHLTYYAYTDLKEHTTP
jgi:hypothetical protein